MSTSDSSSFVFNEFQFRLIILLAPIIYSTSRLYISMCTRFAVMFGTKTQKGAHMFACSCWRLLVNLLFCAWQIRVLIRHDNGILQRFLSWDRTGVPEDSSMFGMFLFEGYPDQEMASEVLLLLCTQIAWYLQDLFPAEQESRSEKMENMFHHVTTLILVIACVSANYLRSACVVLLALDFCNVTLYITKSYYYFTEKKSFPLFILFALSFFLSRLVAFPCIVYSVIFDRPVYIKNCPFYLIGCIFVGGLQPLFIFWFAKIVKMVLSVETKVSVTKVVNISDHGRSTMKAD
eukprot:GILK01010483.1.p1 GENE.GILK01010483.1~~GILK01010483.1.p1  ORF type:complete len:308 (+),score=33.27 GILK01010483.1:52-924(+)